MKYHRSDFIRLLLASTFFAARSEWLAVGDSVMMERKIPGSQESLPAIGLGTWQTFDVSKTSEIENLETLIQEFLELSGKVIDSSPMYGRAEEVTGKVTHGDRKKFFFATKVWTTGNVAGKKQIEDSFRLLQTDVIDLLQIHNLLDWQTHIQTLRQLKEKGKIRYIGLTHYLPSSFGNLEKIMRLEKPDFIQIPYSVVVRDAEKRILPLALENNIGVLVNRPFEGGDIFRKISALPIPEFASHLGSWPQILLKFILSNPAVTCVIPATSKIKHLRENMAAGKGLLPDKKLCEEIAFYIKKGFV